MKSTRLKAIKNEQFVTWPGINITNVAQHLTPTIATAKGHLDQKRKNINSTQTDTEEEKLDMTPSPEDKNEDVFIAFLSEVTNRTVYTDLTRKFPVASISGHKYVMLLYHYDSNGIIFRPMKNRSDIEAMRVYEDMYNYLKARNCKTKLNIMDNKSSTAVKRYIINAHVNDQLVRPNHGKLILNGEQDKATTLWKIPLVTSEGETHYIRTSEGANIACNLEQIFTKEDIIKLLHASLFSPVKSTWLKAIKNEQFVTWLGINTTDVAKHLKPSIATAKGHLDQKRKNKLI